MGRDRIDRPALRPAQECSREARQLCGRLCAGLVSLMFADGIAERRVVRREGRQTREEHRGWLPFLKFKEILDRLIKDVLFETAISRKQVAVGTIKNESTKDPVRQGGSHLYMNKFHFDGIEPLSPLSSPSTSTQNKIKLPNIISHDPLDVVRVSKTRLLFRFVGRALVCMQDIIMQIGRLK